MDEIDVRSLSEGELKGEPAKIFLPATSQDLLLSSILLFIRGITTIASGFAGKAAVESEVGMGIQPGYGAGKWGKNTYYLC